MSGLTAFDSSKTKLEKGVTLLEASAGTGKTYALARIFLRLIALRTEVLVHSYSIQYYGTRECAGRGGVCECE